MQGHVAAQGTGGHDVFLGQATNVHRINYSVGLGKHCVMFSVAGMSIGVLCGISSFSCRGPAVGAYVEGGAGCRHSSGRGQGTQQVLHAHWQM